MTDPLRITVAGAGVAGLGVAAALAQRGHHVQVVERAPAITEVGAGIQVSPNGARVISALGLGPALLRRAIRAERVQLIDGPTGRHVARLDLTRHPDLIWLLVHRADLIDVLQKGALDCGVKVQTGAEITPPSDGGSLDGDDLLIGADGLNSAVRSRIEPAAKPFFTRQVAWRAVISDGESKPIVEVHMGPGRHLVSYPLPNGRRNIVAVEERSDWAEEGWNHQDDPAKLRNAFSGFATPVQDWLARVETVHLWGLFRHPVARRWHDGRQVLLGDAAHPTLPFLAQGANLALEDAWVLAQTISQPDLDRGLAAYQAARRDRAKRVVDAATRNARNYHLQSGPVRFAAHTMLRTVSALAPDQMLRRFDWLYRHDVTESRN